MVHMELTVRLPVIGVVRTSHQELETTPIQAGLNRAEHGTIEIAEPYRDGLEGLADFSYAWLLSWLHRPRDPAGDTPLRQVPFLLRRQQRAMGIFATRGPRRVNPIGLSLIQLLAVTGQAHDLLDAVALGDRMIVIEDGGIVQTGTPADVTARPRSRYVADLTGVNLLRGTARGTAVDLEAGGQLICANAVTGPVFAVIAPAGVTVHRQQPDEIAPNLWRGTVGDVDLMGDRVRVRIDGTPAITAEVPPSAVDELKLDDGGELWASVNPAAITVYPP